MSGYVQRLGSRSGLRIVDAFSGETVSLGGRLLDNLSEAAAKEIVLTLDRRDSIRAQNLRSAYERNDLGAIVDGFNHRAI